MAGTRRPMPARGMEPDDVLRQAADRRRGVQTQADILSQARQLAVLGQQGDEIPAIENPFDVTGDAVFTGNIFANFDANGIIFRIGPTYDPNDPLATIDEGAFTFERISSTQAL